MLPLRRGAEPGTLDLQTVSSLHNAVSAPASVSLKDVLEKMVGHAAAVYIALQACIVALCGDSVY